MSTWLVRQGCTDILAELVIRTPFEARVTVLVLDDESSFKAVVDGQSVNLDRTPSEIPSTHLLTVKPSSNQSGGKSGDFEIRLSA